MTAIRPFRIDIPQSVLDDLKKRLLATRWPRKETVDDWTQGFKLDYAQELADYWAKQYDWRARQERLNIFDQFLTEIDGLDIHFIHVRSPHAQATPLIITHGWPGSVVEFQKVIRPLTEPEAFGGSPSEAFHVVCPSLPGFGFSGQPTETGWNVRRIAAAWDELMLRLGYERYIAQGGDWGAQVTQQIALQDRGHCRAIHINVAFAKPTPQALEQPDARDREMFEQMERFDKHNSGYAKQQSTKPQTLGYGLVDSPVGQMAWIAEKFRQCTDCDGRIDNALSKDEVLDNIMFYWLPATAISSAQIYWESFGPLFDDLPPITMPTGISLFPKETFRLPRSWADTRYKNIIYWNENLDRGGHFAAFEQPELFVKEIRNWFGTIGGNSSI